MKLYRVSADEHRKNLLPLQIGCLPLSLRILTQGHPSSPPSLPAAPATYGNRFHGAGLTAHGLCGDNLAVAGIAGRILAKHNTCALNMWSGGGGAAGGGACARIAGSKRRFL